MNSTNTTNTGTIKVMCDLETLSTKPNAAILSIALVPFYTIEDFEPLYLKVDKGCYKDYLEGEFHTAQDTLDWWSNQEEVARAEAFSGTVSILGAVLTVSKYIKSLPLPIELWGNGATFDNVILANAFNVFRLPLPWSYRHDRCYRTLAALFPHVVARQFTGTKHTALADARYQANHAEDIFDYIW